MCVHTCMLQSCPTLCDPIDSSPPGSFVHGISQARIVKWVAISSFRGSSWPRDLPDPGIRPHLSKPIGRMTPRTPRVNPKVYSGLWVMMTCQCRFISCNKCPICWGCWWHGAVPVGAVGVWYISAPSFWFCCEPKTALKNKILKKIRYLLKSPISFYF